MDRILVEEEGPIGTLTLNRPDQRNAYDLPTLRALRRSLARLDCNPAIDVIVIRGAGGDFCTGGDASMLSASASWEDLAAFASETFRRVQESRKPVVAAVEGYAIAGGFELMLACDMVVARSDARMGDGHIRHGLYPGGGTAVQLPRLIGLRRSKELLLSGDWLSGEEAAGWGIVNLTTSARDFENALALFCRRFTEKSPTSQALIKRAVNMSLDADRTTLSRFDVVVSGLVGRSDDAREGIAAFQEGRAARWQPQGESLEADFDLGEDR